MIFSINQSSAIPTPALTFFHTSLPAKHHYLTAYCRVNFIMMKYTCLGLYLSLISCTATAQNNVDFNGNFEKLNSKHQPAGWSGTAQVLDSVNRAEGRYSLMLTSKGGGGNNFVSAIYAIPHTFKGSKVELRGKLKTQDVKGGYAGLWLRVDADDEMLQLENMYKMGVTGTTDWKEYTINVPYDDEHATRIVLGGLLTGSGTIWIDDLKLYVDGKPVNEATLKQIVRLPAQMDTTFARRSGVDTIVATTAQTQNLKLLGEVWGLVKYYHPLVARGQYNMDAQLFRVLPQVLKATDKAAFNAVLEKWVDGFGAPAPCTNCKPINTKTAAQTPDYGSLFKPGELAPSLVQKLKYLVDNHNTGSNFYVDMFNNVGNPVFTHELNYNGINYPDAGLRLLALYRYWNMIQYFFPYKHLIGQNWEQNLTDFIPQFTNASNSLDYELAALSLISSIHDTHASVWSRHETLEDYRGRMALPVQTRFIDDKLVVTGFYADTLGIKQLLHPGDVITAINGVEVGQLVKKYLPITAASNYAAQLRDMPNTYLLRSNKTTMVLDVVGTDNKQQIPVGLVPRDKLNTNIDRNPAPGTPGYRVMDGNIGYVFPARYKNAELPQIKKAFKKTKGIIVDMRCYPSDFMPFTFVPYIKQGNAPFVKFTSGSITIPGLFSVGDPLSVRGSNDYSGKVVVIVNERTQSQAEYTTMAFQASPNVTVIGSTTAGADGNVSYLTLPGGISTMISGLDVLYPDGTETQRKGVKIDHVIRPTIAGIKAGRDELLEKAIALINDGK
jgi:C-terminal processing protease CtpA/Prc